MSSSVVVLNRLLRMAGLFLLVAIVIVGAAYFGYKSLTLAAKEVQTLADSLASIRGIKHAQLTLATEGKSID